MPEELPPEPDPVPGLVLEPEPEPVPGSVSDPEPDPASDPEPPEPDPAPPLSLPPEPLVEPPDPLVPPEPSCPVLPDPEEPFSVPDPDGLLFALPLDVDSSGCEVCESVDVPPSVFVLVPALLPLAVYS